MKEDKYYEYGRKLEKEIPKFFKNIIYKVGVEEMDMDLSTTVAKENDLERLVDSFTEAMQTACRAAFKIINTQSKTQKKSVPWWTDSLTIMRKRINALRLHQRTRNNEELRESRKHKYLEEKKKYQYEIRKEKLNSWKEYCNVAASLNPWSHAYKLATGKVRTNSIMTTLRKPDGTVTSSILETMNSMLDHLITDDGEEENQHHKNIRKMIAESNYTSDGAEFTQREIKQTIESFNRKKAPGMDGIASDIVLRTLENSPE